MEKTNLSTTHVSYIENGHTKLSVQSLVDIASALEVSTDWLLKDSLEYNSRISDDEIKQLLQDCSQEEVSELLEIMRTVKKMVFKK